MLFYLAEDPSLEINNVNFYIMSHFEFFYSGYDLFFQVWSSICNKTDILCNRMKILFLM